MIHLQFYFDIHDSFVTVLFRKLKENTNKIVHDTLCLNVQTHFLIL